MPEARPTETELKFLVSAAAADGLLAHPALQAPERTQKLRSVYYDTPGWRLRREHLALRVRETGSAVVQTLKQQGGEGGFTRGEWEQEVKGGALDLDALARTPAAEALEGRDDLEPVFVTNIERSVRQCVQDGGLIEVGYDVGHVEAGGRRASIRELELELKQGDPSILFDLARRLAADVDIRLSFESKSERGYRLAENAQLEARLSRTVPLDSDLPAGAAFRRIAISCLAQVAANAEVLGDVARPEAVHQMRVGIRRLRAVMKAFEPMLPGEDAQAVKAELTWLARELDQARDLDVLISSSYVQAIHSLDDRGLAALGRQLLDAQTKAYREARAAACSRRSATLWLEAAAWIETGAWTKSDDPRVVRLRDLPIRRFTAQALDRLRRAVRKRARGWSRLDAHGRHKLRIRGKRLRYAAELFEPLFGAGKRRKVFLDSLKEMQGVLGDLNDIVSARERALEHSGAKDAALAFSLGRLVGWREVDEAPLKRAAAKRVEAFCEARPFWR